MENQKQLEINGRQIEGKKVNALPSWIIGQILRKLSVIERLRCERVDWKWNWATWQYGWTEQKKLSYAILFERAKRVKRRKFTKDSLVALHKRMGANLIELDIHSFMMKLHPFKLPVHRCRCVERHHYLLEKALAEKSRKILQWFLPFLPSLFKIDIEGLALWASVQFLPERLCEIRAAGPFIESILTTLAKKCPHLEAINFCGRATTISCVNDFLVKYPGLKKLHLSCSFWQGTGTLTSIGELRELEEIEVGVGFDQPAFEAMISGCKRLRRLKICTVVPISEKSFCKLAKLSNLVELILSNFPTVTDSVVMAISKCQNLKKLDISRCTNLTDASIVYLVEHCKTLVTLDIGHCFRITEQSLEAVVAEVNNRHGNSPRPLPKGPSDDEIFYFRCENTAIDSKRSLDFTAGNPWLKLEFDRKLEARTF